MEVGIGKARTAAIFRRPSREFEGQVRNGRVAAATHRRSDEDIAKAGAAVL